MISQHSQQLSQPTQTILTPPFAAGILSSSSAHGPAKDNTTVCGWLINRSTLETCLVIHRDRSTTIGRHLTSDLILTENTISNCHCQFYTSSVGFVMCEDVSTNGTYWNGSLIGKGESVVLSHGDSIRIRGNYHFIFQELTPPKLEHEDVEIGLIEKTYQILPLTLGKGTFAKVHVAIHRKTKAQLAVKIMDRIRYGVPEYSGGTDIEKEVTILRTVDHANIVPVVDTIKTTRYIYIFMQMVTGGDLFDYIVKNGPLSELEAKFVAYQTLLALQYLHNINISHRDLKPENLLLTSTTKYPRVLLTDFGMARQFEQGRLMNTMCGTFAYMAPEVFDVKHAKGSGYGYTADCWSLGVTLYVVLSGTHPFTSKYATEDERTMRLKMKNSLVFPSCYWKSISPEARQLIKRLLTMEPGKRWSVQDALRSNWIQDDIGWLHQRYRETVLAHWIKSSQHLGSVVRHAEPLSSENEASNRTASQHSRTSPNRESAVAASNASSCNTSGIPEVHISSIASSTVRVPDVSF
ncbi:kinase-like domain-containing protein [Gamsiella multidivaricata]|uniref:kinase-like domain-containing protein n=1 Tax=Gamsiella multidivaricata TaxID=101098 RepID=UPI0022202A60|nr:kinase-like domain-containing protein [Gamsiella multidivaricata]KAI7815846.1 kinase-like domain-containing protein [Gamsiella multidivaricata]